MGREGKAIKRNAGRYFFTWIVATCMASGLVAAALVHQEGVSSLKWVGATALLALLFSYCLWLENRRLFRLNDDGQD